MDDLEAIVNGPDDPSLPEGDPIVLRVKVTAPTMHEAAVALDSVLEGLGAASGDGLDEWATIAASDRVKVSAHARRECPDCNHDELPTATTEAE